jgi:hypothetical protein
VGAKREGEGKEAGTSARHAQADRTGVIVGRLVSSLDRTGLSTGASPRPSRTDHASLCRVIKRQKSEAAAICSRGWPTRRRNGTYKRPTPTARGEGGRDGGMEGGGDEGNKASSALDQVADLFFSMQASMQRHQPIPPPSQPRTGLATAGKRSVDDWRRVHQPVR